MTDATQKEWNRIMSERIVGNAPKPATPEAPEWKIAPPPRALIDLADMELKARQEVCGITDLMRGVSQPADRALEDFTARRKAKREVFNDAAKEGADQKPSLAARRIKQLMDRVNGIKYVPPVEDALARAMSTPLPHDPPMSVRLMPWRGKE